MLTNNEIKYYYTLKQKKFRDAERKFLAEGFHLVGECLSSDYNIECIIIRDDLKQTSFKILTDIAAERKIKIHKVPEKSFAKLSETENSQGILAVVLKPDNDKSVPDGDVIIALENINDPGNLGTILRTAYWFGINSVLVSDNSADIYNSKVLRSSQGAVFRVNVFKNEDFYTHIELLKSSGYEINLLTLDSKNLLGKTVPPLKAVYVFGNEANGISHSLFKKGYNTLKIEGFSNCESLNVAVSCGILLNSVGNH